ncbi:MAG TPA: cation diffusion facilitator family transporter [Stellaceae bacterium]|nr:cation diffusion facilitator family transporter [Stellaceae bacterium]
MPDSTEHRHDRGHAHQHGHHQGHDHAPADFGRAFAIGIALNLGYLAVEAGFGIAANSLALISDAAHNLGDVLALGLAWGAAALSGRRPTARYTYGLRRSSILAALANGAALLIVTGAIALEAIMRLLAPEPTHGNTVAVVAAAGIVINGSTALMFLRGRKRDLNVRGAFQHMAADALVSLGVVVAGVAILLTGWQWLDPAVSLAVSAVIVAGTWELVREAASLSLDAVPRGIDRAEVETYLRGLAGVTDVHDLHIWAMSTTETALTAHLICAGEQIDTALLPAVCAEVRRRFGIGHATIQLETEELARQCALRPDHVV